jgi:cobalt/nickel transport protein
MAINRSWWLGGAAVAIIAAPLVIPGLGGEFKGSDDIGSDAITASPGFHRWVHPIWEPPSDEVESLLFALQAAIGAGVIGYVIGRRHAARQRDDDVSGR